MQSQFPTYLITKHLWSPKSPQHSFFFKRDIILPVHGWGGLLVSGRCLAISSLALQHPFEPGGHSLDLSSSCETETEVGRPKKTVAIPQYEFKTQQPIQWKLGQAQCTSKADVTVPFYLFLPFYMFHLPLILVFAVCSCSLPSRFQVLRRSFPYQYNRIFPFQYRQKVTFLASNLDATNHSLCHFQTGFLWLLFKLIWNLKLLHLYHQTVNLSQ